MARIESTMVKLGTEAPAFELEDVVSGKAVGRDDVIALAPGQPGLLVMFLCVHCPFVKHIEEELARIGRDYEGKLGIAAISSNDIASHPEDDPAHMRAQAKRLGWNFPYLFDETQEVARQYAAVCTPDFFLFDADRKLVYRGQLDPSRPGSDTLVTGSDLRSAIDAVLSAKRPDTDQHPSIGCNIKWRS